MNGDGVINADDKVRLGNSLPEFQFGGNLFLGWKDWDFSLSFQGVGLLISVLALTQTGIALPLVLTAVYAFLSIRFDGTSILDFLKYAAAFLITKQQFYDWRLEP